MDSENANPKTDTLLAEAQDLVREAAELADKAAAELAGEAEQVAAQAAGGDAVSALVIGLTVFMLAVFVGYHVVWRVTPALHSPLMAVTNAISSVIIVGALIAAGPADFSFSGFMGFIAVMLAAVNIFGGFIVTQRMLAMFKKRQR